MTDETTVEDTETFKPELDEDLFEYDEDFDDHAFDDEDDDEEEAE